MSSQQWNSPAVYQYLCKFSKLFDAVFARFCRVNQITGNKCKTTYIFIFQMQKIRGSAKEFSLYHPGIPGINVKLLKKLQRPFTEI